MFARNFTSMPSFNFGVIDLNFVPGLAYCPEDFANILILVWRMCTTVSPYLVMVLCAVLTYLRIKHATEKREMIQTHVKDLAEEREQLLDIDGVEILENTSEARITHYKKNAVTGVVTLCVAKGDLEFELPIETVGFSQFKQDVERLTPPKSAPQVVAERLPEECDSGLEKMLPNPVISLANKWPKGVFSLCSTKEDFSGHMGMGFLQDENFCTCFHVFEELPEVFYIKTASKSVLVDRQHVEINFFSPKRSKEFVAGADFISFTLKRKIDKKITYNQYVIARLQICGIGVLAAPSGGVFTLYYIDAKGRLVCSKGYTQRKDDRFPGRRFIDASTIRGASGALAIENTRPVGYHVGHGVPEGMAPRPDGLTNYFQEIPLLSKYIIESEYEAIHETKLLMGLEGKPRNWQFYKSARARSREILETERSLALADAYIDLRAQQMNDLESEFMIMQMSGRQMKYTGPSQFSEENAEQAAYLLDVADKLAGTHLGNELKRKMQEAWYDAEPMDYDEEPHFREEIEDLNEEEFFNSTHGIRAIPELQTFGRGVESRTQLPIANPACTETKAETDLYEAEDEAKFLNRMAALREKAKQLDATPTTPPLRLPKVPPKKNKRKNRRVRRGKHKADSTSPERGVESRSKFFTNKTEIPKGKHEEFMRMAKNTTYSKTVPSHLVPGKVPIPSCTLVVGHTCVDTKTKKRPPTHPFIAENFGGLRKPPGTANSSAKSLAMNFARREAIIDEKHPEPSADELKELKATMAKLYKPNSVPFDTTLEGDVRCNSWKTKLATKVIKIMGTWRETSGELNHSGLTNYPFCGTARGMTNHQVLENHQVEFVSEFVSWVAHLANYPMDKFRNLTALELITEGLSFPFKPAEKSEFHAPRKANVGRYRIIQQSGLTLQMLERILYTPTMDHHKSMRTEMPSQSGTGFTTDEQLRELQSRLMEMSAEHKNRTVSSDDVTGWEYSTPLWLQRLFQDSFVQQCSAPEDSRFADLAEKLFVCVVEKPVFVDAFGRMLVFKPGYSGITISGRVPTTFSNSQMRASLHALVMMRMGISDEDYRSLTNGDDHLCFNAHDHPLSRDDKKEFQQQVKKHYADLGFTLREQTIHETKCGFCSTSYDTASDDFPTTSNPDKMTANMCQNIVEGAQPHEEIHKQFIFALRHHPEKGKYHSLVSKMFGEVNLVDQLPIDYDALIGEHSR